MKSYDWARYPTIPCEKLVLYKGNVETVPVELNYSVGGTSLVDQKRSELTGRVQYLICNKKHGCKRPNNLCICTARGGNYREFKRARAATSSPAEARKMMKAESERKYNEKVRTAQKATFGPKPEPSSRPACVYALAKTPDGRLIGSCVRGTRCTNSHEVFIKEGIDPASVECRCPKRATGKCAAGANCIYKHDCEFGACAPCSDHAPNATTTRNDHGDNQTLTFAYSPPAIEPPPRPG